MIKPLLINALESALNQYLALDSEVDWLLTPLAGKVVAIHVLPFQETLYFCPTTESVQVLDRYNGTVDSTLTGSLLAFGLMNNSSTPMRSLSNGEVTIEGDTHTAHRFQQLFKQLDIDLEEKLAHITGDVIAHQIGQFFRRSQQWSENTLETLKLNSKEFLQQETKDLPANPEAQILYQNIDDLRADLDRLTVRIEQLK